MPRYDYQCGECDEVREEYHSIHDGIEFCPVCGGDYSRVPCAPHTNMKEFVQPIEMHSVALCHPDDILAFKQRNPEIDISDNPRDPLYGVPIARTRKQKVDILKREGFEERN